MKICILLIILCVITPNTIVSRKHKSSKVLSSKGGELSGSGKQQPPVGQAKKKSYTYMDQQAQEIFEMVYNDYVKLDKQGDTKTCLIKLFGLDSNLTFKRTLWTQLTTEVVHQNALIDTKWLRAYAKSAAESSEECAKFDKEWMKTDAEIKASLDNGGVSALTTKLKPAIKKILVEATANIRTKMNKFITSAASVYRNTKMVAKNIYEKLNNGGKLRVVTPKKARRHRLR